MLLFLYKPTIAKLFTHSKAAQCYVWYEQINCKNFKTVTKSKEKSIKKK